MPQIPGDTTIFHLLRMGSNLTLWEAKLWGDFRVFAGGKATLMAHQGRGRVSAAFGAVEAGLCRQPVEDRVHAQADPPSFAL